MYNVSSASDKSIIQNQRQYCTRYMQALVQLYCVTRGIPFQTLTALGTATRTVRARSCKHFGTTSENYPAFYEYFRKYCLRRRRRQAISFQCSRVNLIIKDILY